MIFFFFSKFFLIIKERKKACVPSDAPDHLITSIHNARRPIIGRRRLNPRARSTALATENVTPRYDLRGIPRIVKDTCHAVIPRLCNWLASYVIGSHCLLVHGPWVYTNNPCIKPHTHIYGIKSPLVLYSNMKS